MLRMMLLWRRVIWFRLEKNLTYSVLILHQLDGEYEMFIFWAAPLKL